MYMKENVQKVFTKEDVDKFIEELNSSVGSKEKVSKLLSIKNLPVLLEYLRRIGVNPELLEYAAIVEFARYRIIRELSYVKTSEECKVTDKGMEYKDWNLTEKMGVDEDGVFHLSSDEYFSMPDENGEVYLMETRKGESKVKRKINKYGIADLEYNVYGGDGWYTEERKKEGEIPYIIIDETDGATYGYTKKVVDFGRPVYINGLKSNFEENYYTYTSLFPRTKVWYDSYYWLADKDISEFSRKLDETDILLEIEREEKSIEEFEGYCSKIEKRILDTKTRLGKIIAFLKTVKQKSPIGNEVASKILEAAKLVKKLEDDTVGEEENKREEVKDSKVNDKKEDLEEKLERLREKSKELKVKLKKLENDERYYNGVIRVVEREITNIPLIGRRILSVASKYKVENDKQNEILFND